MLLFPTPNVSSVLYTELTDGVDRCYSSICKGLGVCVVCVFFPSILDIKFVGRTSRGHTGGRSHRIFNPPSFCGACLDFLSREGFSHSFPSSTVKSNFVY